MQAAERAVQGEGPLMAMPEEERTPGMRAYHAIVDHNLAALKAIHAKNPKALKSEYVHDVTRVFVFLHVLRAALPSLVWLGR